MASVEAPEPEPPEPEACPVCMEPCEASKSCVLRCGHLLCNDCITRLATPHCPMCRAPVWGGKPPERGGAGAGAGAGAAAASEVARQIAEDARMAAELSRQEGGSDREAAAGGAAPDRDRIVPLPFHFSTQRAMTYSSFD